MDKKIYYSVGELAQLSGTTIRTIQYYDKINLLIAKRDQRRNLRYYTQSDLLTLQQILFYKKLGIPLKHIKKYMKQTTNISDTKEILQHQSDILFQKEMEMKMNRAIIEAIVATLETSNAYDFEPMMQIALRLNKNTILDYANIEFDKEINTTFNEKYTNDDELVEVYWQWKQLVLEASFHKLNNISYKSDAAYQFGQKWDAFIKQATGNDPEVVIAYEKGLEQSHEWPEEDLFLYNFCNDFIDKSHNYYCKKGDV